MAWVTSRQQYNAQRVLGLDRELYKNRAIYLLNKSNLRGYIPHYAASE